MSLRRPEHGNEPESPLVRWSRRKRRALDRSGEPAGGTPAPAAEPSRGSAPRSAEAREAPPALGDSDMPPLDSLGPESDYSGFLSPGVSEELRRLALRKLFLSPLFNVTDGLDDYDDDFRSFEVLKEAFHARRDRAPAAESAGPEHPESETEESVEPARSAPAETAPDEREAATREEESASAPRLPAGSAGEDEAAAGALSLAPAPPAERGAVPAGEAGEANEETRGPDEAESGVPPRPPDAGDSTTPHALPADTEERDQALPDAAAESLRDPAEPVRDMPETETSAATEDAGRNGGGGFRHG